MNNAVRYILTFSLGAAVGAVVSWGINKTRYERKVREEVEDVREKYSKFDYAMTDAIRVSKDQPDAKVTKYETLASNYISASKKEDKKEVEEPINKPYVISPEEFGDEDYERITLVYYSDDVLADIKGNLVEDVGGTVGVDSLTHFGEYEDDAVHVRNDELKKYYEILLDSAKYADVVKARTTTPGGEE